MERPEVVQKVRSFVQENFLYMRPDVAVGDNDPLLGNGIVDSMGVMEIIEFLEDAFSASVLSDDITEENLGTINAIADYVVSHNHGAAQ